MAPDALTPDALTPDALTPDALTPDALTPDALTPDALTPDALAPDALAPDALAPDALAPVRPVAAGAAADGLMLQLLAWIDRAPRSYGETMEAWRSHCPRLSVWEDATIAGLVRVERVEGAGLPEARVRLTPAGRALLDRG
ncbi:MAG: hypothetical protein AB7P02_14010 [Alphaproteobacteria bacterium]